MAKENEVSEKLESRINIPVPGWTSKEFVSESGPVHKGWVGLKCFFSRPTLKIRRFLANAWSLAVADPIKVIHGCKVGLALTLVSLFYYIWPLFDGLGGNTVWAVLTVVVVFESTVGATISKSINRAMGTSLGGSLAVGVQMIARTSGKDIETVIVGIAIFFLAAVASFVRFIPSLKARFDYGVMIWILTFSMISVNGYRVEKVYEEAYERLVTVCIGTSFCIFISMLVAPIWAVDDPCCARDRSCPWNFCPALHKYGSIGILFPMPYSMNFDDINDHQTRASKSVALGRGTVLSIGKRGRVSPSRGCVTEFFKSEDKTMPADDEHRRKRMQGYKSVLNTKASEESMANFARWEPAHGLFSFGHPWKQYLKTGAAVRNCAYFIEALHTCVNSEIKAPDQYLKKSVQDACLTLSGYCSDVLKELALTLETMTRSSKIEFLIVTRIESIVDAVDQLANLAKFKLPKEISGKTEAIVPEKADQVKRNSRFQWLQSSRNKNPPRDLPHAYTSRGHDDPTKVRVTWFFF
ncbi:Aluminum-activated malate transporter 10 [Morella rubra]|uniref:Aluminum-activated malate transporter 10 n=1 Tax=Morella rubra TaxID=262757 RepID=A0A6A1URT8_9ROSI|nr:Aluminum-activated malate transporter 10 [Morella rubra]